jgi:hypothetical protein
MDDAELYREQILRHAGPYITGRFLGFRTSYTREVRIGRPLVLAVFLSASLARILGAMLRFNGGGARRKFKELKKGPEFLVTPVRVRDDQGQLYEVELHGHLAVSALRRGDLVQITTSAQADRALPVKLLRMVNLTTMQPLTPRIPTMWSHLGPALLIQAILGLLLAVGIVAIWVNWPSGG